MTDLLGDTPRSSQIPQGPVTEWALRAFREHYGNPKLTTLDIIHYAIGILHADDYRERYRVNLKRELPRIPFADEFEPFRVAGEELMQMQLNWRDCDEYDLATVTPHKNLAKCRSRLSVDDEEWIINGTMDRIYEHFPDGSKRIAGIQINKALGLVGIPAVANRYKIAGFEPIEHMIRKLKIAKYKSGEIYNDPNDLYQQPAALRRHIQQVVWISVRSGEIIAALPPAIPQHMRGGAESGADC